MVILPCVFNKTLTGNCLYKAFIIILYLDMLVVELTLNWTVYQLHSVVLTLRLWMKTYWVIIQIKAIEYYEVMSYFPSNKQNG